MRWPRRLSGAVAVALVALVVLVGCGTPAPVQHFQRYVALGDSYTAAPFVQRTKSDNPCLRSTGNYPSLLAEAIKPKTFVDVSCSGAKTTAMTKPQPGVAPPQFDALSDKTDLVTVSIGGNDGGVFGVLVFNCVLVAKSAPTGAPCEKAMGAKGSDLLETLLVQTRANVLGVLRGIKKRAPHAKIVVVGYPRIAPASGTCAQLPVAAGDYAYVTKINEGLNDAMRLAAQKTGATFIDVWKASIGHDICAKDPWINGGHTDLSRALEYHPFANEQQAVAELIENALK